MKRVSIERSYKVLRTARKQIILAFTLFLLILSSMDIASSDDDFDITVVQQANLSTVNTIDATNVEETTATANGLLVDDGGAPCRYRFEYDIDSGVPYAFFTAWTGAKISGQTFSGSLTSLTEGELYYFRAQANNSGGIGNGAELFFLTKPDNPTSFQVARDLLVTQLNLTWTMGAGADRTVIIKKQDSYPANRADGTVAYNGTADSYEDGTVTTGNHYYYRAWSYCAEGGLHHYSDTYDEDNKVALEPAAFDVRDITILDSITPDLMIMVVVENTGGITADIIISWTLVTEDTGAVLDTGTDTFEVTSHTETTYIISPTTSYVGSVEITFTGDGVTASKLFATVTQPTGGGGAIPPSVPPEARDTDGDGLTDKQEEFFGSDPLLPDTDFDGYTDYEEYVAGTDPRDARSYPGAYVGVSTEIMLLIMLCVMVFFILFIFVYEKRKKKKRKRKRA